MIIFPLPSKICSIQPNRTISYKLERVLNTNLESFPSAMFPKLWNTIEIDPKETKSAKIFKQRIINIYLENYERLNCEKSRCISCVYIIYKKIKKINFY